MRAIPGYQVRITGLAQRCVTMLRIASYNIHQCVGRDGQSRPQRIRRVLRNLDADICALQEVEQVREEPGLLAYLCEGRPWHAIHGPTLFRNGGDYGNAVITSLPVQDVRKLDISESRHEPRGVLWVTLEYRDRPIDVVATHLGLWPGERRAQVNRIIQALTTAATTRTEDRLTIMLGDLNEWFLWGRPMRWLAKYFGHSPAPATFPAHCPVFSLDRVWCHPRRHMNTVAAVNSPLTRIASDHLPLAAELTL